MWPIGPDPFVSTDMHEFYRSLAADAEDLPPPSTSHSSAAADSPSDRGGVEPLWQLMRYMAWTILGPSTALTTLCILLLDGASVLDWKVAILALSSLIWLAPYGRTFLFPRREEKPEETSAEDRVGVGAWETLWH